MEIGDTFKVKKGLFSSPKELKILEEYIAPFLSEQNYTKMNQNGVGPRLDEKIIKDIKYIKISKKRIKLLK